jgi:hypothetical protein
LRRVIRIEPPEMVALPALESFQMKAFISFSTKELSLMRRCSVVMFRGKASTVSKVLARPSPREGRVLIIPP